MSSSFHSFLFHNLLPRLPFCPFYRCLYLFSSLLPLLLLSESPVFAPPVLIPLFLSGFIIYIPAVLLNITLSFPHYSSPPIPQSSLICLFQSTSSLLPAHGLCRKCKSYQSGPISQQPSNQSPRLTRHARGRLQ